MPGEDGAEILDRAILALAPIDEWTHGHLESVLRTTLIEDGGYKPRIAFGPLRAAISGRRISPPLFESMELLGKDSSMVRLQRLRDQLP
jgi:glutamyl-tRNA synthetase